MSLAQPNATENARHVALLARCVHESSASKGCSVQSAETGPGYEEREDQRADGAEDLRAECDGDGVGGLDYVRGKDEEVGYVCQDVAEDDEGERGVNYAGEVARGVFEFGGYVVDLGVLVP